MGKEERDLAKPIADMIVDNIVYYMRYSMNVKVTQENIHEFNRLAKSIIVQHMLRKSDDREEGNWTPEE